MVAPSAYAPNLPVSLEKIILKCTQKNADRRYQTMGDLLLDLKKSLINPDEDFVTLVDPNVGGETRKYNDEDLERIKKEAESVYYDPQEEAEEGALPAAIQPADPGSETTDANGVVNINTADAAALKSLSGIGDAKAQAILTYREEHGFFSSIEEIMQVPGIKESTFSAIKDKIAVK